MRSYYATEKAKIIYRPLILAEKVEVIKEEEKQYKISSKNVII